MNHPPISIRLGPRDRGVLDDLALRLGGTRADVVRLAIRMLDKETEGTPREGASA